MKKRQHRIIVMIIIAALFTMTACGNTNSNTDTETDAKDTILFEASNLALEYCNGTWDGTFLSTDEHCASIEDGVLWIDCSPTDTIPDMGPVEDYWTEVVRVTEDGTWIYDSKTGNLELWEKGIRYKKLSAGDDAPYYSYVSMLSNCIVVRYGSSIDIFNLDGYRLVSFNDIIDVYETETEIFCSTFEHDNFKITGDGEIVPLKTKEVRFERVPGEISESTDLILTQAFNLFYGEGWDGKCRRLDDGQFLAVNDYTGDIIVNNKIVGNVCLGDNIVADDGVNIHLDVDTSYWLDGSELHVYKHGPSHVIDVPDGTPEFIWFGHQGDDFVALAGKTLYSVKNDTVQIIYTNVEDANVADDLLYYMEGNKVYRFNWLENDATSELFFNGAYAVSHFADEAEGAIVPFEESNYKAYGYSNIYSPYGTY